jgi:hypothetical protein
MPRGDPEFLTVDLDLESREPLGRLADALPSLIVMLNTKVDSKYVLSLELSRPGLILDQTFRRLAKMDLVAYRGASAALAARNEAVLQHRVRMRLEPRPSVRYTVRDHAGDRRRQGECRSHAVPKVPARGARWYYPIVYKILRRALGGAPGRPRVPAYVIERGLKLIDAGKPLAQAAKAAGCSAAKLRQARAARRAGGVAP